MRNRNPPFNIYSFNLRKIRVIFGEQLYDDLRTWIDLNYRLIRAESRRQFLLQCKHNNIFPSHLTHINRNRFHLTHYKSISKLEKALHIFRTTLLNTEIFDLNRIMDSITRELFYTSKLLSDTLPPYIWNSIINFHFRSFNNSYWKLFHTHKKKFRSLLHRSKINKIKKIKPITYNCLVNNDNYKIIKSHHKNPFLSNNETCVEITIDPLDFFEDCQDPLNHTNESWFINLSNSHIPKQVSNLLQLGDKFSLPIVSNKKQAIHEVIKDMENNIKNFHVENQTRMRNTIIPQFHKFLHIKPPKNNITERLTHLLKNTIKFNRNNPDIIFTRADKGNITVALNRSSYLKKMEELLEDTITYTIVKKDPSSSIERKLNGIIKKWYAEEYISKLEMLKLRSSDSLLPKAYGLPKVHKTNAPLRIIVSSINTTLYPIAKYLNKIISDSIPHSEYQVKNSFDLCIALSSKTIPESHSLVSLDVVSLFTNVPLDLAINSINKRWEYIERFTKIDKSDFMVAVEFVLSSTYFTFNNIIYKQIFGTPMGSPLSPIVADLVMRDLEEHVLNSLNIRPSLYYRYVDDIILTAPKEEIHTILNEFNSYHQRLNFTLETEDNHSLNFLDITLITKNTKIITDWYHKNTFSGRFLSFFSNHPICHKVGTIYSLVDRAIKLSHPSFQEKNLRLCIKWLLENGYPLNLIFNKINLRLKKLFTLRSETVLNTTNKTQTDSHSERRILVFPYINPLSEFISSNIDSSKAMVGFRCLSKLNRFVKAHKDKDHILSKNNVVYKIFCKNCESTYVGQTKRKLSTRLKEHKNNLKQDQSRHSVISEHTIKHNHSFDWDKTKIMDIESRYSKRIISEMIHIKEQKVSLNLNSDTELLDESYFDILYELTGH